jgi:hypothetical protein
MSRSSRLAVGLAVTALVLAAMPALTSAAAGDAWAWAVVRSPERGWQAITGKDSGSSTGRKITVKRLGQGYHRVRFGGFTTTKAHFQVTPLSGKGDMCTYYGTGKLTGATEAYVNCRNREGKPRDIRFMINMIRSSSLDTGPRLAYLWAHMPTATTYTPHPDHSFNSLGRPARVDRLGAGRYAVRITGFKELGGGGGSLQVTAFGSKPRVCLVASIGSHKDDLEAIIRCRNDRGKSVDTKFDFLYHEDEGLKGSGGPKWAYLYADRPTTKWYEASWYWTGSAPAGTPTVKRIGKGRYVVKVPTMPLGGAVQVTAVDDWKRCHASSVRKSSLPQRIEVRCFKSKGNEPGDAGFMLSYAN